MNNTQHETQRQAVRSYVHGTLLGGQTVSDDEELLLSGMVDSLGVMSLVSFIEQTYGIEIPFEDVTLENLCSITAISKYADGRT
ncbi:acyl carrier protein [Ruegeria arenilitoris]|uniref:acyl carrier protein n=1 Tax=Ruegeria arenilitoris TaxID=1173585 RepID=UPI0014809EA7|nr:acyl carrier protein [Ruegeria arenilitoris]